MKTRVNEKTERTKRKVKYRSLENNLINDRYIEEGIIIHSRKGIFLKVVYSSPQLNFFLRRNGFQKHRNYGDNIVNQFFVLNKLLGVDTILMNTNPINKKEMMTKKEKRTGKEGRNSSGKPTFHLSHTGRMKCPWASIEIKQPQEYSQDLVTHVSCDY